MTLASSAVLPFFFGNVLGKNLLVLGPYFALLAGSFVISQPLWVWVSNRWSKATTYRAAVLIAIPFYLTWLWGAHGEPLGLIYARAFIIGFLAGGALLAGQALLPDTIEYDYLMNGLRREGIFAGFYTTMEKVSGAAGIGIVGVLLSHAGYVASRGNVVLQPHSALIAIRYIVAVLPAVLSLLCFLVLLFYNLTDEKITALRLLRIPGCCACHRSVRRGCANSRANSRDSKPKATPAAGAVQRNDSIMPGTILHKVCSLSSGGSNLLRHRSTTRAPSPPMRISRGLRLAWRLRAPRHLLCASLRLSPVAPA
jgi:hypothetical protein